MRSHKVQRQDSLSTFACYDARRCRQRHAAQGILRTYTDMYRLPFVVVGVGQCTLFSARSFNNSRIDTLRIMHNLHSMQIFTDLGLAIPFAECRRLRNDCELRMRNVRRTVCRTVRRTFAERGTIFMRRCIWSQQRCSVVMKTASALHTWDGEGRGSARIGSSTFATWSFASFSPRSSTARPCEPPFSLCSVGAKCSRTWANAA